MKTNKKFREQGFIISPWGKEWIFENYVK